MNQEGMMPAQIQRLRRRRRLAVSLVLTGLLLGGASSAGQTQPAAPDAPRHCPSGPPGTPDSCSGQALDAFRKAAEAPRGPDPHRLRLTNQVATLADARVGQAYPPTPLAIGGSPTYYANLEAGRMPAGMGLDDHGQLLGTPTTAGRYEFALRLRDNSNPAQEVRQAFQLTVLGPTPKPHPARLPPPPPPPPAAAPIVQEPEHVDGRFTVFVLRPEMLKDIQKAAGVDAAPPASAASGPAVAPSAPQSPAATPAAAPRTAATPAPTASRPKTPALTPLAARLALAVGTPREAVATGVQVAPAVQRATAPPRTSPPSARASSTPASTPAPLAKPAQPDAAKPPAPAGEVAFPANLAAALQPLINIEYPRRDLFERAVLARYPAGLTSRQLAALAEKTRDVKTFDSAKDLAWIAPPGCHCAPTRGPDGRGLYGFFPFWRETAPAPAIDFSQIDRIGFVGAELMDDGTWVRPTGTEHDEEQWWAETSDLARAAQDHGGHLDLVLHRRDWGFLAGLTPEQRQQRYEAAAHVAVVLADTPLLNRGPRGLLLPIWRSPTHVFDGLTIMLDYPIGASEAVQAAYFEFEDGFIREVIKEMQKTHRAYALNIVAPDLTDPPASGRKSVELGYEEAIWGAFLSYKKLAEPASAHPTAPEDELSQYVGTSKIRVSLLVPLAEPTHDTKRALRASIDRLETVHGYNRSELLQSLMPIMYLPSGGPVTGKPGPITMTPADSQQLDDDLVYAKQNFAGVAFWPAPVVGVGVGDEVYQDIQRIYSKPSHGLAKLAAISICNLWLRLTWQGLVLATALGAAAYLLWGQISGRASLYLLALFGLGATTIILGVVLLYVDPALETLSRGNLPLLVVLSLVGGAGIWFFAKPRIPPP